MDISISSDIIEGKCEKCSEVFSQYCKTCKHHSNENKICNETSVKLSSHYLKLKKYVKIKKIVGKIVCVKELNPVKFRISNDKAPILNEFKTIRIMTKLTPQQIKGL